MAAAAFVEGFMMECAFRVKGFPAGGSFAAEVEDTFETEQG